MTCELWERLPVAPFTKPASAREQYVTGFFPFLFFGELKMQEYNLPQLKWNDVIILELG